jgi:threonylcarbamoyladenosine tRNA methylthiotransferase MtaB
LLNELDISYLHVFSYSERPNTIALKLNGIVPKAERTRRSKMLQILSQKKKRAFYQSQLGKIKTVLFENENHDGFIHGFTENYIKVRVPYSGKLKNTIQSVELLDFGGEDTIEGKVNINQDYKYKNRNYAT